MKQNRYFSFKCEYCKSIFFTQLYIFSSNWYTNMIRFYKFLAKLTQHVDITQLRTNETKNCWSPRARSLSGIAFIIVKHAERRGSWEVSLVETGIGRGAWWSKKGGGGRRDGFAGAWVHTCNGGASCTRTMQLMTLNSLLHSYYDE